MLNKNLINDIERISADVHRNYSHENEMHNFSAFRTKPEILFITSHPPRECGIATYSQDLIRSLNNKFINSFKISICPLENNNETHNYSDEINYVLNTDIPDSFIKLANTINENNNIRFVMIQHEFGFFEKNENDFLLFLYTLKKPIVIAFHTVLPLPDESLKFKVRVIIDKAESVIVMTNSSKKILTDDYGISKEKITVIPHGTHLVPHIDKEILKSKYKLSGKKILSTFGLLSSGKSIETSLDALPLIIEKNPDVLFLIIGKTHPTVVKQEGEKYRKMLGDRVKDLNLQQHVQFINTFVPLPELLEYLQLTDIYLFTSKNPNQAVSGTFSYAISCGCPIISTPIPHANEVLKNDAGIIIDFENSEQLADSVNSLLNDEQLRKNISSNGLHRMAFTAWENSAIAHAKLFENISNEQITLKYNLPEINLDHIKKLTTDFGMIQFSKINQPDINSGYTIDDNARAMISMCQHFELTKDEEDLKYIRVYLDFIKHCQQSEGNFLNYVNENKNFTNQNNMTNLEDSNGRAVWALGYLVNASFSFPKEYETIGTDAETILNNALLNLHKIHSPRSLAFVIKGLYYHNLKNSSVRDVFLIRKLADRLQQLFRQESDNDWKWFESYLTYANSVLPEAMLCAWLATGEYSYKDTAKSSFDFLLSKIYNGNNLNVVSNKTWLQKGMKTKLGFIGGEQPIDAAYTILALKKFHEVFKDEEYKNVMINSFNWFLGNNHLHQIIYNPCTGGCYDGLEENYVNLNQGAESTVSYLMARLTVESVIKNKNAFKNNTSNNGEVSIEKKLALA